MSNRLEDRMELRKELDNEQRQFIIDPIFPCYEISTISGASGAGKTTFLNQLLYEWDNGRPIFSSESGIETQSFPCEWVYVSMDRSVRDTNRTLNRLGLSSWNAPIYSMEEIMPHNRYGRISAEPSLDHVVEAFPKAKLIVFEGLQGLMPNTARGQSQNKAEIIWALDVRTRILSPKTGKGVTLIATTHSPKSKEKSTNKRENTLGSQGLIGTFSTMISIDFPEGGQGSDSRVVSIMGRNFGDMTLNYMVGDHGEFELASAKAGPKKPAAIMETDLTKEMTLHSFLSDWPVDTDLPLAEIKAWADRVHMPERTMYRWVKELDESGRLVKQSPGVYRKVKNA